jgi:hypothetical protein
MIHIDVKKLGRIPPAAVWRTLGQAGKKNKKKSVPTGYAFLHSTIDDHSRVVYSEILETKGVTAAAFWSRANAYYESCSGSP